MPATQSAAIHAQNDLHTPSARRSPRDHRRARTRPTQTAPFVSVNALLISSCEDVKARRSGAAAPRKRGMRAEIAATPEPVSLAPVLGARARGRALRRRSRDGADPEHPVAPAQGDRRRRGAVRPRRARLLPAGDAAIHRDRADPRRSPRQAGGAQRRQSVLDRRRRRRHAGREPGQRSAIERRAFARHRRDASRERSRVQRLRPVQRDLAACGLLFKTSDPKAFAARLKAETLQTLRKHVVVKRADKVLVLDLAVRAKTAERAAESPTPSPTPISPIRPRRAPTPDATPRGRCRPARRICRRTCARRRPRSRIIAPATTSSSPPASSSATRRSTRRPRNSRPRRTAPPR